MIVLVVPSESEAAAVTARHQMRHSQLIFPLLSSSLTAETSYSSTSVTSMSYDAVDVGVSTCGRYFNGVTCRRLVIQGTNGVMTPVEASTSKMVLVVV